MATTMNPPVFIQFIVQRMIVDFLELVINSVMVKPVIFMQVNRITGRPHEFHHTIFLHPPGTAGIHDIHQQPASGFQQIHGMKQRLLLATSLCQQEESVKWNKHKRELSIETHCRQVPFHQR